jgi:hypothetical protein
MARIIRERGVGLFANDPQEIARQLKAWLVVKRETDCIQVLSNTAGDSFSRDEQFGSLEEFLEKVLSPKKT